MDKINFVNKGQPAINDTNLNKMQDNIEKAVDGIILYENASGSTGDITLSESAANFRYLEIFYKRYSTAGDYGMPCKSQKISNPNNKYVSLGMEFSTTDLLQISGEEIKIEETSIIRYSNNLMFGVNTTNGQISQYEKTTNFLIEKVVGYK